MESYFSVADCKPHSHLAKDPALPEGGFVKIFQVLIKWKDFHTHREFNEQLKPSVLFHIPTIHSMFCASEICNNPTVKYS